MVRWVTSYSTSCEYEHDLPFLGWLISESESGFEVGEVQVWLSSCMYLYPDGTGLFLDDSDSDYETQELNNEYEKKYDSYAVVLSVTRSHSSWTPEGNFTSTRLTELFDTRIKKTNEERALSPGSSVCQWCVWFTSPAGPTEFSDAAGLGVRRGFGCHMDGWGMKCIDLMGHGGVVSGLLCEFQLDSCSHGTWRSDLCGLLFAFSSWLFRRTFDFILIVVS